MTLILCTLVNPKVFGVSPHRGTVQPCWTKIAIASSGRRDNVGAGLATQREVGDEAPVGRKPRPSHQHVVRVYLSAPRRKPFTSHNGSGRKACKNETFAIGGEGRSEVVRPVRSEYNLPARIISQHDHGSVRRSFADGQVA